MTYDEFRKGLNLSNEAEANAKNITLPFINEVQKTLGNKIRVTSTVRSAVKNRAVHGVANSKHLDSCALAADFVPVNYTEAVLSPIRAIAKKHGFGFLVHDAGTGNHIHCEFKGQAVKKK